MNTLKTNNLLNYFTNKEYEIIKDNKNLIEKACQNTYDYFDSIIAQIS